MADLPDNYFPPMLYYPINQYSWVNEWTWTDTSRPVKASVFISYKFGTQLWDANMNNTFEWLTWWAPRWAHYRRDLQPFKAPPWYRVGLYIDMLDPAHSDPPDGWDGIVKYMTDHFTWPLMPERGFQTYVYADRMMVTYTGAGWKPMFRLPQKDQNFELQVFANYPVKGGVLCKHVVSQPFKIRSGNTAGRVRGWRYDWSRLPILKNGVEVAQAYKGMYDSGVWAGIDVTFEAGDILEIICPKVSGTPIGVNISIVGEYL